ncbi:IS3 family transposase [Oligoflexus tunisiensis]|uniref:IS3 family transposase n=1 Tax=Oligoflexus tunisiensis TaxID=708132 RepID=UPI00159F2226
MKRGPSPRAIERSRIQAAIRRIFEDSRRNYGSPRIHKELLKQGFQCSETRVERLMREMGIRAKTKRKFRRKPYCNRILFSAQSNFVIWDYYKPAWHESSWVHFQTFKIPNGPLSVVARN